MDGGVTWEDVGPAEDWYLSVEFRGNVGLAYARSGTAWRTADGGETWVASGRELSPPGDKWLAQVAINADATVGYVTVPDWGVRSSPVGPIRISATGVASTSVSEYRGVRSWMRWFADPRRPVASRSPAT